MPDKDQQFHTGHRDRLKEKFLDKKLVEYEQLELLLCYAIPRRDVRPLARKLIQHFGSVYYVLNANIDELVAIDGVGHSTAVLIKLVHSLICISHEKKLKEGSAYMNHKTLMDYCRMRMTELKTEEFHVLYLDADFCLQKHVVHSQGSTESSNVYIEKIMEYALKNNVKSVVLLHNHPSTDNTFSSVDVQLTGQLEYLLNMCNITLYDHFVVSGGIVHSMRDEQLLNKSANRFSG
jgi:DNA repair protein RadC